MRCAARDAASHGLTDSLVRLSVGVEDVEIDRWIWTRRWLMIDPTRNMRFPSPYVKESIRSERGMTEPTNSLSRGAAAESVDQIAPVSWEHPADRAALQSLRSIPVSTRW